MAVDLNKIIQAAAQAALDGQGSGRQQQPEKAKRKGLTGPRALLLGAGVYTAGRLLVAARGGGLVEQLQDRLADLEDRHLGGGGSADEDPADEGEDFEGEEDFDEEPEGEYDEEPEGEYDEEDEEEEEEEDEDAERSRSRRASSGAGRRNGSG